MLRLMLGLCATGLLLALPGPLGHLLGDGSRFSGVALTWLLLAGLPGGRPPSVGVVLGCALPCLAAATRLDPGRGFQVHGLQLILALLLIALLADGARRAAGEKARSSALVHSYELAWWGCLILPATLAACWTWGGLHSRPDWLQALVQLGPFENYFRATLPRGLGDAPWLTLVPWLLVRLPHKPSP